MISHIEAVSISQMGLEVGTPYTKKGLHKPSNGRRLKQMKGLMMNYYI